MEGFLSVVGLLVIASIYYHFVWKRMVELRKEREKKLREETKRKTLDDRCETSKSVLSDIMTNWKYKPYSQEPVRYSKKSTPSRKVTHIDRLGGNTYVSETSYFEAEDFSSSSHSSSSSFDGFGGGGSFGGGGASGSWDSGSSDSDSSDSGGGGDD